MIADKLLSPERNANQKWSTHPGLLLLICGVLFGLNFPLAKQATLAQIPALTWVMHYSLGASLALLPLLILRKQWVLPTRRQLRYIAIAGPITFATANFLVFFVVAKLGAAYAGIMFALSPVFTVLFARALGMRSPGPRAYLGVILGLTGALGIAISSGQFLEPGSKLYLLVALAIPLVLAGGNIYRSLDWPDDASPEVLAFWSHASAFILYIFVAALFTEESVFVVAIHEPLLLFAQLTLAGLTAPVYFRLQRFGGPVTLSQLGYVAAGVSLLIATLVLGERYPLMSWLSVIIIAVGIAITVFSPYIEPG